MYDKPMEMMNEEELEALLARAEAQKQKLAEQRVKEAIDQINTIAKEVGLKVKISKAAAPRPKKAKAKKAAVAKPSPVVEQPQHPPEHSEQERHDNFDNAYHGGHSF